MKLSALDLVQETLKLLQLSEQDVYLLPSLPYRLRKPGRQLVSRYGREGIQRAQQFVQRAGLVGFPYDESELDLLSGIPDIDEGEALLYASTYALQEFCLLTGDKRSLAALAEAPNCQAIVARLSGKVICLEQIIVHILRSHPFEMVLNKVVPARECDTAIKVAFGSGNQTELSRATDTLDEYIRELRAKTGNLLRNW